MRYDPDMDGALRGFYRAEPQPAADPSRVFTELVRAIDSTPQQRRPWHRRPVASAHRRSNRMLTATTLITASVAVATVGGFFALAVTGPAPDVVVPGAEATATATATAASPDPTILAAETSNEVPTLEWAAITSDEVEAIASRPRPTVGHGYTVTIDAETFRHGERVFRDESAVGPIGYEPLVITVERPDGTTGTSSFDKPLAADAVTSPAGVLLRTRYGVFPRSIKQLATGQRAVSQCCPLGKDGVIRAQRGVKGLKPGPVRPEDYRDKLERIGLTPDDVRAIAGRADRTLRSEYEGYWFSADGETWSPVGELDELPQDTTGPWVVGTSAGFFAPVGTQLLHSTDGVAWSAVPGISEDWEKIVGNDDSRPLREWDDKVVTRDRRRWFDASGATGDLLPGVSDDLRAQIHKTETGLFTVDFADPSVSFSLDGQSWSNSAFPEAVLERLGESQYPWYVRTDGEWLLLIADSADDGYRVRVADSNTD